jgi:hypothetical protein
MGTGRCITPAGKGVLGQCAGELEGAVCAGAEVAEAGGQLLRSPCSTRNSSTEMGAHIQSMPDRNDLPTRLRDRYFNIRRNYRSIRSRSKLIAFIASIR